MPPVPLSDPLPLAFLAALKQVGVRITGESAVKERLLEARSWQQAWSTLMRCGASIGIGITVPDQAQPPVQAVLQEFGLGPLNFSPNPHH